MFESYFVTARSFINCGAVGSNSRCTRRSAVGWSALCINYWCSRWLVHSPTARGPTRGEVEQTCDKATTFTKPNCGQAQVLFNIPPSAPQWVLCWSHLHLCVWQVPLVLFCLLIALKSFGLHGQARILPSWNVAVYVGDI